VTADKIVIGEVQADSRFEVLALFAESVCQAGQALHVQARRGVQAFNVAGRNELPIGISQDAFFLALRDLRGAVPALLFDGLFGSVRLDDLAVIDVVLAESLFDGFNLCRESIGRNLHAIF
jgi:hypothetical protein